MGLFSNALNAAGKGTPVPDTSQRAKPETAELPDRIMPEVVAAQHTPASAPPPPVKKPSKDKAKPSAQQIWFDQKMQMHSRLLDAIDLAVMEAMSDDEARTLVAETVSKIARHEQMVMSGPDIARMGREVFDEMTGLGPLEPLLQDDTIADILINGHEQVYIERGGELDITPVRFADEAHLLRIINRIVAQVGRRVDESQPMCDARLLDGSRVNVAIPPVAVDGPLVSIRKFTKDPLTFEKLVEFGAMPAEVAEFLQAACASRITILISGGTGSGKTTLLNALSRSISHKERLITIEDAAELQLQQPHVARMETRPPNVEGKGEIRQRELVKNALRMRPERIILGEVRGEEAFDMLQAMNTGHEGSMATLHANTPRDAITRLEQMVAMGDMKITPEAVAGQIASAIQIIIQATRMSDGQRKLISVAEITGMEGAVIQMQEIFKYHKMGTDEDGRVYGEHRATGIRPKCFDHIRARGIKLPGDMFEPRTLGPKAQLPESYAENDYVANAQPNANGAG